MGPADGKAQTKGMRRGRMLDERSPTMPPASPPAAGSHEQFVYVDLRSPDGEFSLNTAMPKITPVDGDLRAPSDRSDRRRGAPHSAWVFRTIRAIDSSGFSAVTSATATQARSFDSFVITSGSAGSASIMNRRS